MHHFSGFSILTKNFVNIKAKRNSYEGKNQFPQISIWIFNDIRKSAYIYKINFIKYAIKSIVYLVILIREETFYSNICFIL